MDEPRIRISKDGPYLVAGLPLRRQVIVADADGESFEWIEGEPEHRHPQYALCRCGGSGRKPFCDGTHTDIAFDGTEVASRATYAESNEPVEGPALVLNDVPSLCSDARFCHRAGGAWNLVKRSDDPDVAAVVVREAESCPSGRYVAQDARTGEVFEPDLEPSIGLVQDVPAGVSGPIWARGGIAVESADGSRYEVRNRMTLCRCGASRNKPFCDGSHIEIGFKDTE